MGLEVTYHIHKPIAEKILSHIKTYSSAGVKRSVVWMKYCFESCAGPWIEVTLGTISDSDSVAVVPFAVAAVSVCRWLGRDYRVGFHGRGHHLESKNAETPPVDSGISKHKPLAAFFDGTQLRLCGFHCFLNFRIVLLPNSLDVHKPVGLGLGGRTKPSS